MGSNAWTEIAYTDQQIGRKPSLAGPLLVQGCVYSTAAASTTAAPATRDELSMLVSCLQQKKAAITGGLFISKTGMVYSLMMRPW